MASIKGLERLTTLSADDLEKLEHGALLHRRHSNIQFSILNFRDNTLIVEAKQEKSYAENYQDIKTLVLRTKELFSHFFPTAKIHVRPVPYATKNKIPD